MSVSDRVIAISVGAFAAVAYLVAGAGLATDYDYFGRLAAAFLAGHWWLDEAPSWLNELIACGDGRWCVVYPPLPAILSLPFVPFVPSAYAQVLASRVAGGASATPLYLALRAYGAPKAWSIAGTLLSAFGTTLFFSSVDGRTWYAAHAASIGFAAAGFLVAARGGRPALAGALVGIAALGRLPVAAATPGLALLLARRAGLSYRRALGGMVLGGLPFALVYAGYNLLRWGTPFDAGYARLIEDDVFFTQGLFSPLYLPRQLVALFLEPPDIVPATPFFLIPHYVGMSLFLTTPAFLWIFLALREVRRDAVVAATGVAALGALLPDLLHGTVGFQQFGYRFSIDAQPFLVALAISGDGLRHGAWRRWPRLLFIAAIVLSFAVNLYATIAITRFGYWD